jgi:hypothetical protein
VKPATPVVDTRPPVVARPNCCVRRSSSPHAHGDRQLVLARVAQRERDVVGVRAAGDQRGPPVDHRVEDGASLVVAGGGGVELVAGEALNRSHLSPP